LGGTGVSALTPDQVARVEKLVRNGTIGRTCECGTSSWIVCSHLVGLSIATGTRDSIQFEFGRGGFPLLLLTCSRCGLVKSYDPRIHGVL
jgi:hypothetical protein